MMRIIVFLLALSAVIAYAHSPVDGEVIHISDSGFEPQTLEIETGTTIVFENAGKDVHWPASNIHPTHEIYPEFDPKNVIRPGENWNFTFTKPGMWKYHDHINPEFTGTIHVIGEQNLAAKIYDWLRKLSASITAMMALEDSRFNESITINSEDIFDNDDSLYSYVKKFGPKQTITRLYELKPKFGNCHNVAHKAGRFTYEIFGEKAFRLCTLECHSGCYHGAIEAYLKEHGTEGISEALNVICGSEQNKFLEQQCIHGIGHGLTAWSNYELFEALKGCDLLSQPQSCYTGVFMENIVGSLTEDHITKYLNENPKYPCTIVDDKYKNACYLVQTSQMIKLFNGNFSKIASTCMEVPEQYRYSCFHSMGRDISMGQRDPEEAIQFCSLAPKGESKNACLAGAVQDMFWDPSNQETALRFCKLLADEDEKGVCYSEVGARAKDLLSSEEVEAFCQKAEEYQEICRLAAQNN